MIFGSGDYRYEIVEGWGKGPEGRRLGVVSSMATDALDRVYVVDREPHPAIVVFDREGRFLTSWGEDILVVPHSIWISDRQIIYIADCGTHTVMTFTLDGTLLSTLGTPDQTGAPGKPFNKPTWAVRGNSNDLYVTDGYGQNFVHRFTEDGELLCSWGGDGVLPGQFDIPHCVRVDRHGRVMVVDRGNSRVQMFDPEGRYLEAWTHLLAANDLFIDKNDIVYLAEAPRRISILTLEGNVLSQWGGEGETPGCFVDYPHGIWVDAHGDVYVCEVPYAPDRLQKYRRV
jgi:DNA-binding beta-propeller fold protein YncE